VTLSPFSRSLVTTLFRLHPRSFGGQIEVSELASLSYISPFTFEALEAPLVPNHRRITLAISQSLSGSLRMFKSLALAAILAIGASALPINSSPSFSPADLVARDNWDVTRNDLVNGICAPVTVIFARGTLELGNVGSLAGPPFFNTLTDIIDSQNLAVQGVDYPGTIAGYLEGGDPTGATTLASLVNQAVSQCPSTQIVLSGYRYSLRLLALVAAHNSTLTKLFFAAKAHKSSIWA